MSCHLIVLQTLQLCALHLHNGKCITYELEHAALILIPACTTQVCDLLLEAARITDSPCQNDMVPCDVSLHRHVVLGS